MSGETFDDKVRGLRAAFDDAFAERAGEVAAPSRRFLVVEAAEARLALPIEGVLRVARPRRIVPLPGPRAEQLGLCGVDGGPVAVWSLARLLGLPGDAPAGALVVCRGPVALAVDAVRSVEGVPERDVAPGEGGARGLRGAVRVRGGWCAVVDLDAILAGTAATTEERGGWTG